LLAMSDRSTLRHYMELHAADVTLVHVDDSAMLLDVDTPDDYERVTEGLNAEDARSKGV